MLKIFQGSPGLKMSPVRTIEKPREKTRAEVWTIYRDRYRALKKCLNVRNKCLNIWNKCLNIWNKCLNIWKNLWIFDGFYLWSFSLSVAFAFLHSLLVVHLPSLQTRVVFPSWYFQLVKVSAVCRLSFLLCLPNLISEFNMI